MNAVNLKTEYLKDPLGIDIVKPRLFWQCAEGITQTAWQVEALTDAGILIWNSGKMPGSRMTHVPWGGSPLTSRTRVNWRVRVWDERDEPGDWSEAAFFETGLLTPADWEARWITGVYTPKKKKRYPVDCFQYDFSINKPTRKARLYITACGLYEADINGIRVGDFILAPGITDYRTRIQYQTYDVTELIKQDGNTITVWMADGWYRGSVGAWGLTNQYGTETKLLAQLEMEHSDGTRTTVLSNRKWKWSHDGPIRFADNKDGEYVDARLAPSYASYARETTCTVIPSASNNVPVTEHERFTPTLTVTPSGKRLLDFGQNMAGYVAFLVTAEEGQQLTLRFGELIDSNGELTQANIQCRNKKKTTPLQRVDYICRKGTNRYKTKFAIFGFQYVEVDTELDVRAEDFTAFAVYSDMAQTGHFESSNELLNRFVEATRWSAKGNSVDLPTDCPTRERHGWTGDAQIFFETAGYLFDYAAFAKKYLRDMYDWQKSNGCLPQIAPAGGVDFYMDTMNGSVGWSDAGVLIPYRFWKLYGDDHILREHYNGMRKYAHFMINRCGKWGGPLAKPIHIKGEAKKYLVNRGQSYGEWAEPADVHPMRWTDMAAPHPEVSTAYTAYVMAVMAEIAEHLGIKEDAKLFQQYSLGCRKAYQLLSSESEYTLDTNRQARLVRPLALGLLNEEQETFAKHRLIQALEYYKWRLGTGFLSTPLILDVLADIDLNAAYRLLENEEMPGWLFMPKNGASTVWESWEGTHAQGGIASLNHYSKGACCQWLFKSLCGILVAGENHFAIAPKPGGRFTYATARYNSIFGTVESGWERQNGKIKYTIIIPANTTADIVFLDGTQRTASAGRHQYVTSY